MEISFWEAALLITIVFVTVCVLYYWCASTASCCVEDDIELAMHDTEEANQRGQAIFTITTVLMGENACSGQHYNGSTTCNSSCTNTNVVADDCPPTYDEAIKPKRVATSN